MRTLDLRNRSIIVTGGTQGIGKATVGIAMAAGAAVTIMARTKAHIDEARRRYPGERFDGLAGDISSETDVRALFDFATERFGRVDSVIHAAAIMGPIGRIGDVNTIAWWQCIKVDLFGSFLMVAEACRRMERARGGRIVLFSGGGATTPFPRYSAYASSKVAIARMVESVAIEYADSGIQINAVSPGFVATKIHEETLAAGSLAGEDYLERTKRDLAAGGVPPEVGARCACFLASPSAEGITGRIVAAPWDDWEMLPERVKELDGSDLFTLRRIVPRDRGSDWQ